MFVVTVTAKNLINYMTR